MKIFIDFDDVIFNTKKFVVDLKEVFFANGVSEEIYNKYVGEYKKKRDDGEIVTYSLKDHIKSFKKESGIDFKSLKKDLQGLIKKADEYVFEDFEEFAKKIGKNNLYLVSYGNKFFQKLKIKNSGVRSYFKKVLISEGLKSEKLAKLFKNGCTDGCNCYFMDDRAKHLEDIKKSFPEVKTLLIQRKEGRYFDEKDGCCDYVVEDLEEALKIIKAKD